MMVKVFVTPVGKRLVQHPVFESLKISAQKLRKIHPIIIYQMGKVGSTTVYESLKNLMLPNPMYHVHFLSHDGIKNAEEYFSRIEKKVRPLHIRRSKMLCRKIEKNRGLPWKIITIVREPVSRDISDFFQTVDRYHPELLLYTNGSVDTSKAIEFLQNMFTHYDESTDYTCTWFDNELRKAFDIDVYAYPFSHSDGFCIIREKNVEVLILRIEDLDHTFNNALNKFLNLDAPIEISRSNIGKDKRDSREYRYILENIALPKRVCTKIYTTKYAKHFYDESMRSEFIRRWSKE